VIIQHLKHPFHHTIIYNFFDGVTLDAIKQEIISLIPVVESVVPEDAHHTKLLNTANTPSTWLDKVFGQEREASKILTSTREVFSLCTQGVLQDKDNPFIGYIPTSNHDTTYVQLYKNGSSYFPHQDAAVVTMLYPILLGKDFEGGKLTFTRYDYTPHLEDNCCLIFPSFEPHALSPVNSKDDGYVRASINQRLYIK